MDDEVLDINVRRKLGQSPESVMKDFMDRNPSEYLKGFYSGKVVNNKDPERLGKCQIRVYACFGEEIPDSDLPWALPDFAFIGSTLGSFIVPPIGAIVKVYFDNGDIYLPHYTTKAMNVNTLPSQKDTDYPDNMVFFETDNGDYFTINRKSKQTKYFHTAGTNVVIEKNGEVKIFVVDNKTETVVGDNVFQNDHHELPLLKGKVTIFRNGNIKIEGQEVYIGHMGLLKVEGSTVIPTGIGPLNALPIDPITGIPHSGNICSPGLPI